MSKMYKKIISMTLIFVLTLFSAFTFGPNVFAEDVDYEAYIAWSSEGWGMGHWNNDSNTPGIVATNAAITNLDSDEEYTVGLDFTGTAKGFTKGEIDFSAIQIENSWDKFEGKVFDITDVLINGVRPEKVVNENTVLDFAPTITMKEDDEANVPHSRVNLYNVWVKDIKEGYTKSGQLLDVTATPLKIEEDLELETLTIKFKLVNGRDVTETNSYFNLAGNDWSVGYWYNGHAQEGVTVVEPIVEEYDTEYETSLDFGATTVNKLTFVDLEIVNGEVFFPNSFMEITEVKLDDQLYNLNGNTYTNSDNLFDTRTNLYNEWVSEINEGRTLYGSKDNITATPFTLSEGKTFSKISIKFKLRHGGYLGENNLTSEGTKAYLNFDSEDWVVAHDFGTNEITTGLVVTNDTITGYGEYSVKLDFSGVAGGKANGIGYLGLEIKDGEELLPWNYIRVDKLLINNEEVTLGNTYTYDEANNSRVNLYNEWASEIDFISRRNGIELNNVSATPLDTEGITDVVTIEVKFTVLGHKEVVEPEYEIPETFHAFMMFSSKEGGWEIFKKFDGGGADITGDGTYTLKLTKEEAGGTSQALDLSVFIIDIEKLGEAMKHLGTLKEDANGDYRLTDAKVTIKVKVDGVEVTSVNNSNLKLGDIEDNGRFRIEIYNEFGTGTKDKPGVAPGDITPENEVEIEFTITGTGINPSGVTPEPEPNPETPEPETPEPETPTPGDDAKEKNNGLVITLIVIGSLAVVGGASFGAFVFIKKRK